MVFGFGRRSKKAPPEEPLAAYDRLLEDLERQGSELRKAAATLLAVQGELGRDQERLARKRLDLDARLKTALARKDEGSRRLLGQDLVDVERSERATAEALATAEADGKLLLEAARELSEQVRELRQERVSAKVRLTAGQVVSAALRQRVDRVDRVLAVEKARDEVERAHALEEIYREDRRQRG